MKNIITTIVFACLFLGTLYLILHSPNVIAQQYKTCMITYTDKTQCEKIKK